MTITVFIKHLANLIKKKSLYFLTSIETKNLIQNITYFVFVFAWVYYIWFIENEFEYKEYTIFFNLLLIFIAYILFLNISFKIILNSFLAFLIATGILIKIDDIKPVSIIANIVPESITNIIGLGFIGMMKFSLIIIPLLILIKVFLIKNNNKFYKFIYCFIVSVLCVIVINIVVGVIFFEN